MLPILCMCEFVYTLWCLCVSILTNRYHNDLILNAPRGVVRVSVTNYQLKSQFSSTILIPILFAKAFRPCLRLQYSNTLYQSQLCSWPHAQYFCCSVSYLSIVFFTIWFCGFEHGGKFSTLITILYCQFGLNEN